MRLSSSTIAASLKLPILLLACSLVACQSKPQAIQADNSREWEEFIENFLNSCFAANPDVAVWAGRHEFDGKLPDWSKAGIQREIARLSSERDRAMSFNPEVLSERQRFEQDYVIAAIEGQIIFATNASFLSTSRISIGNSWGSQSSQRNDGMAGHARSQCNKQLCFGGGTIQQDVTDD